MQLKLQRSQRTAGMMAKKIVFGLNARVHLTPEEDGLVKKYGLANLSVYDSEARKRHADSSQANASTIGYGGGVGAFLRGSMSAALAAMSLRVTIASLTQGQHIECKDLEELLGAETAIRDACANVKTYLEVAKTFDGREEVVEF